MFGCEGCVPCIVRGGQRDQSHATLPPSQPDIQSISTAGEQPIGDFKATSAQIWPFLQLPTSNFVRVTVPPEDPAENSCDRVAICARWYEVNQRAGMLPKWWGSATAAARNHQRRCSAPARMAHFFLLKNTTSSLQLVLISRLIQNGFDLQTPAGVLYLVIARASAGIGIDPSRVTLTFCPNEVSVPSMIISRK